MLLTQALTILTWSIWIIYAIVVILYLWRTVRVRGLVAALRGLLTRATLVLVLIALFITLLWRSIVFIEPQQVGVVISILAPDGYRDRPYRSGVRWLVPFLEEAKLYPISWQTYTMGAAPSESATTPNGNPNPPSTTFGDDSISARTSDGQEVLIDSSVVFQIDPEQVIRVHIEWQGRYMDDFVRPVVRGLVRTQVSQYTVDEVNSSKRLDLERDLDTQVRATFQGKGLVLDRFILRNIAFSPEYAAAVEQKQIALQNRIAADYKADETRKLAQGDADATRMRAQAQADALALIEQQIAKDKNLLTYQYIDKLSPSIRTMLLPSTGQYILPVPTFEEPGAAATSVPAATAPVTGTVPAQSAPSTNRPTPTPTRKP